MTTEHPEPDTPEPDPQPNLDGLEGKWRELAAPFPLEEIELRPQPMGNGNKATCQRGSNVSRDGLYCGNYHGPSIHLKYVGHAGITSRLNKVDPTWNWEPLAFTPQGTPLWADGGMWIKLTVLGITRLGFGDSGKSSGANATKEVIGDALRNAAMRFGVGTYLWSKSEKAAQLQAGQFEAEQPTPAPAPQPQPGPPANTIWGEQDEATFQDHRENSWNNLEQLTHLTQWYTTHTPLPDGHRNVLAARLQELHQQAHVARQQAGGQA